MLRIGQPRFIYFAVTPDRKLIKIGFSYQPETRIAALRERGRLTCLGVIRGTMTDERIYHERFEKYRVEGEWYTLSDEILDLVTTPGFLQPCPPTKFLFAISLIKEEHHPGARARGREMIEELRDCGKLPDTLYGVSDTINVLL